MARSEFADGIKALEGKKVRRWREESRFSTGPR
jgi:hypothetical protein